MRNGLPERSVQRRNVSCPRYPLPNAGRACTVGTAFRLGLFNQGLADWAVFGAAAAARGGMVGGWVLLGFWRFVIGE